MMRTSFAGIILIINGIYIIYSFFKLLKINKYKEFIITLIITVV